MLREFMVRAREGLESINLRHALGSHLRQRHCAFRLNRRDVLIANLRNGKIALRQRWLAKPIAEGAKDQFVRADAKRERRSVVVPTARTAA